MKNKLHIIIWVPIVGLLILYRLLGTQGGAVLLGSAFFGIAVILLGGLMVWLFVNSMKSGRDMRLIASAILGALLIVYGAYSEVNVVRDMQAGTVVSEMNSCYLTSRSGIHGIVGFHYYLNGTSREGEKLSFPVSRSARNQLDGLTTVTVEYYEHVGRIVDFR